MEQDDQTEIEKEFFEELLEAQKEIGILAKDKENPYHHNKYADINDIIEMVKPILNKRGLLLMQPLTEVDGKMAISTIITGHGNTIEYSVPIPQKDDPQKAGSAITYFRRYALQSMLCIQAEDDDANSASVKDAPKMKPVKPSSKPAPNTPDTPTDNGPAEEIPTCSICAEPMKPTKSGSKNKFYCKHGSAWGVPVYKKDLE